MPIKKAVKRGASQESSPTCEYGPSAQLSYPSPFWHKVRIQHFVSDSLECGQLLISEQRLTQQL